MAKLECMLYGTLEEICDAIHNQLMNGSATASYEDGGDYSLGDVHCVVRIYERYSYSGGNRVSMSVTLFGSGQEYRLCAVTSGGSQAVLFKINTWGEEAFLEQVAMAAAPFRR